MICQLPKALGASPLDGPWMALHGLWLPLTTDVNRGAFMQINCCLNHRALTHLTASHFSGKTVAIRSAAYISW